ncbi:hypothetical protein LX15_005704 [Streptoalloteichus tenebrarius]|uniref:Sucrase ferredoxin n=1 Tax=Streptoalloteichus tenebrarius (strain ATCC 17920 / DSM 40477 / JCM 4838 / CBS 697.72 / NBRC 16177 / NCIMB 11028 / NRRL B-12390 / A12253. 1 / ISP 5477) TaxID=1933 RepID=A0ABT1I2H6_STRSD|nr:hypothetical protein [Streptoalloteichus tenebrarius]BFF01277.1 sucrase ferredoxin [Streptoalloteichus tenebrarius]
MSDADCAVLSARLGEPLPGTAPTAPAWLCLEQPGPWGDKALVRSHLDPAVGAELQRRGDEVGVRVVLIRRPGHHADTGPAEPRRVYLAHTRPGASWLEQVAVRDAKDLLDLDFGGLARGERPEVGEPCADPLLLVCTNGRRDRCCALLGRPVADELAARHPGRVWESTHTGGHRLAPAAVALPTGYAYGRLDVATAEDVLRATAEGVVAPVGCRGRSTWSRFGQVAELVVRERVGERDADAVLVEGERADGDGWRVLVAHRDGRAWEVLLGERPQEPPRPVSCGKAPSTPSAVEALSVTRVG